MDELGFSSFAAGAAEHFCSDLDPSFGGQVAHITAPATRLSVRRRSQRIGARHLGSPDRVGATPAEDHEIRRSIAASHRGTRQAGSNADSLLTAQEILFSTIGSGHACGPLRPLRALRPL